MSGSSSPFDRMSRRVVRIALTLLSGLSIFVSTAASAVVFEVTELTGCAAPASSFDCLGASASIGTEFTIGLRVRSAPGEAVFAIGASIWDYDRSVVEFVNGSAAPSIFHDIAIPGIGAFGGIGNVVSPTLAESSIGLAGPRVQIFNGVGLAPHGENPLDPGLDGILGGGDAQIRVRFRIVGAGAAAIRIGTDYVGDGVVYAGGVTVQSTSAIVGFGMDGFYISVVPEPTTALLLGLGLAALAGRRPSA